MVYRVAVVGLAHMHVNELIARFVELPDVELVAVADTPPDVPELNTASPSTRADTHRRALAAGRPRDYADWRALLDRERPDIVLACPENNRHGEVAEAAFAAGAHVVVEKPMAAALDDARRMVAAAARADRRLMVNYPTTWSPAVRMMKRLLDAGEIGRLWQVHERHGSRGPLAAGSAHPGLAERTGALTDEEKAATWWHRAGTGGGALLDYCSYGACLARWAFGAPAVSCAGVSANLTNTFGTAEDNAVLTVRFPAGLALLEASWSCVDHAMPTGPIFYGTEGTLSLVGAGATARVRLAKLGREPVVLDPDPLPDGRNTLAREFLHHLRTGEPLHETLDPALNLDATAILDAGGRACASGRVETVDRA